MPTIIDNCTKHSVHTSTHADLHIRHTCRLAYTTYMQTCIYDIHADLHIRQAIDYLCISDGLL